MSCVKRRKSRRKLKHQHTDIEGLTVLLTTNTLRPLKTGEGEYSKGKGLSRSSSRYERNCSQQRQSKPTTPTTPKPAMKMLEDDNDLERITFRVGNVNYEMSDSGKWTSDLKNFNVNSEIVKFRETNQDIFYKTNMLRVKNELLADMIAKKTVKLEKLERDLQTLKKLLSKSSSRFSFTTEKETKEGMSKLVND